MTAGSFCAWVNKELLPSRNLPPNFPRSIGLRTATRWLHRLGYRPQSHKKGAYVDGHERDDVIAHRREYLDMVKKLHDSHLPPPPSGERAPTPPPDAESKKKLVLIYHDESIFSTNEGRRNSTEDKRGRYNGVGIEHDGFLKLSSSEAALAKYTDPTFSTTAREYGAEKEGYWEQQEVHEKRGGCSSDC